MFVKKAHITRSKEEKLKILLDVQQVGVVSGCRKHSIQPTVYYDWLQKYNTYGIEGLDRSSRHNDAATITRLSKELELAKQVIAEKEMQLKLQGDLLKKKIAEWKKGGKS